MNVLGGLSYSYNYHLWWFWGPFYLLLYTNLHKQIRGLKLKIDFRIHHIHIQHHQIIWKHWIPTFPPKCLRKFIFLISDLTRSDGLKNRRQLINLIGWCTKTAAVSRLDRSSERSRSCRGGNRCPWKPSRSRRRQVETAKGKIEASDLGGGNQRKNRCRPARRPA